MDIPLLNAGATRPEGAAAHTVGSARISAARHLPDVLREFNVDPAEVLAATGLRPDLFDDPENRIAYPDFGRLLLACERLTRCDHFTLLVGQRARLADFGLSARLALCSDTAGEALQKFADAFTLHNDASVLSLITSGDFSRIVYSIIAHGMQDTRPFQLGAMAMAVNILQELCGRAFVPTVVTLASRAPADLRPVHRHFRSPVRFDSEESALVFERRWLDRPLPPVDPAYRRRVTAEAQAQLAALMMDFPDTLRGVLRKQLLIGHHSMDDVASLFGMHRRTLDRRLQQHGTHFGDLLDSVKEDVARQLLSDTRLQVQQIAEALRFSSAANFATAFRRWTGVTPSQFRHKAR